MRITIDEREHATILAALRLWQHDCAHGSAVLDDIASNGGTVPPLDAGEIDALCERINLA